MATSARRIVAPEPPADLDRIALPVGAVPPTWYRITGFPAPLFWSRQGVYRFDSPEAKWGVCYAAESIPSACQEIWGDEIRRNRRLDWLSLQPMTVWQLSVRADLKTIELAGETLVTIKATLQSFVSGYPLSQRWGAALMNHPANLDAVQYLGRRSGRPCLALFGDESKPRPYQAALTLKKLGPVTHWAGIWPFLDRIQVRVANLTVKPHRLRYWDKA